MTSKASMITATLAGVGAGIFVALMAPTSATAQIKDMTVGPDGRPIKVAPYSTEEHEGLLPKDVTSRGDEVRRLTVYKADPVKFPVPRTKLGRQAGFFWRLLDGSALGSP